MKKLFDYFQGKDSKAKQKYLDDKKKLEVINNRNMKKIKEEHEQKMKNEQKIHEQKMKELEKKRKKKIKIVILIS